ncbi:hypothetical protein AVEN_29549-1 [Araneus ventricosus]|uniref:Mos1 transposase HTH domain-containing protein n=1 Tax=Araneus ventricosus TaxID=182803 RepID=A0A4Y2PYI9_ARAVE|nr:hypothetical protein AVEN_29549-1 [Araneus ventricosus]
MFTKSDLRSWMKIEVARVKNASERYHGLREACTLPSRTLGRWVKAFCAGRNEIADPHHTGRPPFLDIVSSHLSIDRLWTVWELSVEVGFSHQTVWHILKKWRMLGDPVAVINKQHLANSILRLPNI